MQAVLEILFTSLPGLLARHVDEHDILNIPVGFGPDISRWFTVSHAIGTRFLFEVHT